MNNTLLGLMFGVGRIRGKNEFDIYTNLERDISINRVEDFIGNSDNNKKMKNNNKSEFVRKLGNQAYVLGNYEECLKLFNKSLRYAVYNTDVYCMALANRSAAHLMLLNYESCLVDINLCLQIGYPNILKPKLFIRKAVCFQKMGNAAQMRATLLDMLSFMDENETLLTENADKYRNLIKDLITAKVEKVEDSIDINYEILPNIEENPLFCNASSSVRLKYNKKLDRHVIAGKDIKKGDVLFVEPAELFTCYRTDGKYPKTHCHFCMALLANPIPCKECVKSVYCSEICRDNAWNECHKWECSAFQIGISIVPFVPLSFRAIIKLVRFGLFNRTRIPTSNTDIFQEGNCDYPLFLSGAYDISKVDAALLRDYAIIALLLTYYLNKKTDFFIWLKEQPTCADKNIKQLMNKVGSLILKYCVQFNGRHLIMNTFQYEEDVLEHNVRGFGICSSTLNVRHSCMPNAIYYFVGKSVVVKALTDIKKNEEIQYSYKLFVSFLHRQERRLLLNGCFNLNCKCRACENPKASIDALDSSECINCRGPALIIENETFALLSTVYECLDCKCVFKSTAYTNITAKLIFDSLTLFTVTHELKYAVRCLSLCNSLYGPYHRIYQKIYAELILYYFHFEVNLKMAIMYVDKASDIYKEKMDRIGDILLTNAACRDILGILKSAQILDVDSIRVGLDATERLLKELEMKLGLVYPPLIGQMVKPLQKLFEEVEMQFSIIPGVSKMSI